MSSMAFVSEGMDQTIFPVASSRNSMCRFCIASHRQSAEILSTPQFGTVQASLKLGLATLPMKACVFAPEIEPAAAKDCSSAAITSRRQSTSASWGSVQVMMRSPVARSKKTIR